MVPLAKFSFERNTFELVLWNFSINLPGPQRFYWQKIQCIYGMVLYIIIYNNFQNALHTRSLCNVIIYCLMATYIGSNSRWQRTAVRRQFILGAWYYHCPACRTSLIATRFWVVVICPIIKCLTVLEFSFILFDLWLFITIFNFILNYVPIVTFWVFTYHKIWILLIIFCFIWNYWIIYVLTCLEVFWGVVS